MASRVGSSRRRIGRLPWTSANEVSKKKCAGWERISKTRVYKFKDIFLRRKVGTLIFFLKKKIYIYIYICTEFFEYLAARRLSNYISLEVLTKFGIIEYYINYII